MARVFVLERLVQFGGNPVAGMWELVSVHWDRQPAEDRIPRLVEIENSLRVPCQMRAIAPQEFRVREEQVRE